MWKSILIVLVFIHAARSIAGTTYIPQVSTSVIGADGFFKCGGDIDNEFKYTTEAKALSCVVTDRKSCEGFMRNTNCKIVEYSYPAYAEFRAKMENKKVKYVGLAPMYVGVNSELRVMVYVNIIPQ